MTSRREAPWVLILAGALFVSATGSPPSEPPKTPPATYTTYTGNQPQTAAQKACVERNCKLGLPTRRANAPVGPTRLVFRQGYVLEHSSELRIPYWVCEQLTKEDLQGKMTTRLNPEPFGVD